MTSAADNRAEDEMPTTACANLFLCAGSAAVINCDVAIWPHSLNGDMTIRAEIE